LGGQICFGHVDGVGRVLRRRQAGGELALDIGVPAAIGAYLVPKGPVAVDGVALTVGDDPKPASFTVHLIPETLRQTTLASRQPGERVNIEIDYLTKLMAHFMRQRPAPARRRRRA
jgi:riboflavin synthase